MISSFLRVMANCRQTLYRPKAGGLAKSRLYAMPNLIRHPEAIEGPNSAKDSPQPGLGRND